MSIETNSGSSADLVEDTDPITGLVGQICIVHTKNASFCARLIAIRGEGECWFQSRGGQQWMLKRPAMFGIRPLHDGKKVV
jgi:hypothetical protein